MHKCKTLSTSFSAASFVEVAGTPPGELSLDVLQSMHDEIEGMKKDEEQKAIVSLPDTTQASQIRRALWTHIRSRATSVALTCQYLAKVHAIWILARKILYTMQLDQPEFRASVMKIAMRLFFFVIGQTWASTAPSLQYSY